MSLDKCIPEMLADGRLNQEQADEMGKLYRELEADYSTKFGAQAAKAMASEETLKRLEADAIQKRRQDVLQMAAQQRIAYDMGRYDGPPGRAATALFDHDDHAPYSNVEMRRRVIEGQAHAMISGILEKHSRNFAGRVRGSAELRNLVRETFGEDTGDLAAKELAEAWGGAAEMLRTRFNAAGGAVGKLDRWGLPQTHNLQAVRAVTFSDWRDFTAPKLDRQRMLDPNTGMPMTSQAIELALRHVYEEIRSDGWASRTAGGNSGAKKLANRRAESRFLVFKDGTDWLAYSDRFGRPQSNMANAIDPDGPIFDAMMGHIGGMSRDIALAEVLGPNPAATTRWITDKLKRDEALSAETGTKGLDAAVRASRQVERLFDEVSGRNSQPESRKIALGFSAARSWQTAAKLGSATLSAITDVSFQTVTRRFNGLPVTGAVTGYLKLLKPGSAADRQLAMRMGLVAEEASKMAAAQSRYLGEALAGEVSSRLAEGVLRASGLSAWTQAGRWAFGMEFLGHITGERGKAFKSLNPAFRGVMERYGFTSASWDALRQTPIEDHRGSSWIMPANVASDPLRNQLMEMILTETDYAVPVASLSTRALINSVAPKGTWMGEIVRSALLFKSFGISMMLSHGRRAMEQQGWGKLKYAAGLTISTTVLGALAMQLKALARGQDPQPMEDPAFWGQAMAQGGGFGIYGDFINSATSRFDDDVYSTIAGPLASEGVNTIKALHGKHPGRDAVKFLKRNLPGSSLWYTKTAFQRTVLDQMQMQVDPEFEDSFDRMEQRARENGQEYYWRPGERVPGRAPELANALAEPAE